MSSEPPTPHESYLALFIRFLRFGLLAWGGPVAQIAMIRQELVDEKKWITKEKFNRILGVYQALPGPEAHELCVYFGFISRGRLGGILAGLGFMFPGLLLMLGLSWFYVAYGIHSPIFSGLFFGFQAVVGALLIRAVHRIGRHTIVDRWLFAIAGLATISELLQTHFAITLGLSAVSYFISKRKHPALGLSLWVPLFVSLAIFSPNMTNPLAQIELNSTSTGNVTPVDLLLSGLRSGLLTFGGAYTVIPFLQHDAISGGWMTNTQFLDGIGLSGVIPAPLVIIGTFVGYLGGGFLGAILMTIGIFFPAFAFTIFGHKYLERIIENKTVHSFLDGLTAGAIGLIGVTTIHLLQSGITNLAAFGIFAISLLILYVWKSKIAVPVIVMCAGIFGTVLVLLHLL
ncbi:MAG: chromate efflux transporter [Candidatus Nitrosotenuis sp.]